MLVSQRFNQRIVGRQLGGVRFSGQDCSGDSVTAFAFDVPEVLPNLVRPGVRVRG